MQDDIVIPKSRYLELVRAEIRMETLMEFGMDELDCWRDAMISAEMDYNNFLESME